MDWDDLRFFLAVARKGSIRAASSSLSVNHSTVLRRINAFEEKLNVRLFERLPTGYVLTPTGEEMVESAQRIEDEVVKLDRQVIGRDAQLSGVLRVTMPLILATHLLAPEFAAFTTAYPGIQLELAASDEEFNLKKREADVAIRITPNPPDYLVGRKILKPAKGIYASHNYLKQHDPKNHPEKMNWLGWEDGVAHPQWVKDSEFPSSPIRHQADSLLVQLEAAKADMGLAMLPCFLADPVQSLQRLHLIPSSAASCGDLWILTHKDLRSTARVRVFVDFMVEAFDRHCEVLEGRSYTCSPKLIKTYA
ncbi:MAG TPA: LysR family transcriptional regulator [Gammaproteobacteria bacterium]|nr:LysR family transcriptional regulator [Gammaproteobacteria bacterium]